MNVFGYFKDIGKIYKNSILKIMLLMEVVLYILVKENGNL